MWDLPGPGLEPMSPALAGGLLTTAPPGKSLQPALNNKSSLIKIVTPPPFIQHTVFLILVTVSGAVIPISQIRKPRLIYLAQNKKPEI